MGFVIGKTKLKLYKVFSIDAIINWFMEFPAKLHYLRYKRGLFRNSNSIISRLMFIKASDNMRRRLTTLKVENHKVCLSTVTF